jgi:hypothetical protein
MPSCIYSNSILPWHIPPKVSSPSIDAHPLGSTQPFLDPQNKKDFIFYHPIDSDEFKEGLKGSCREGWVAA